MSKSPMTEEIEHVESATLSPEHREFLLTRHGTVELLPLPSNNPDDPLNWPAWRKNVSIVLVSFHAMMTTFVAAGIIPAFMNIAKDFDISLQTATYFTSMQIAMLGVIWRPFCLHFGMRPTWLISTFGAAICNIGCALSYSFGGMTISRLLAAFFISPAMALGTVVVTQMFFEHERGQKMGIWALMVTLGPPLAPFLMGFVAFRVGWRWILWIDVIVNFIQFLLYLTFIRETAYPPVNKNPSGSRAWISFDRFSLEPFRMTSFLQPLLMGKYLVVTITTVAYSVIFSFAFVVLTVEIPHIFGEKFGFNEQQLGLQFLGMIIGGTIGEQAGGPLSDLLMNTFQKKHAGRRSHSEYRLWLFYPGFAALATGFLVWGFQTANLPSNGYNVSPVIGIGISSFGAQIITTVVLTYMVDCYPSRSADIGIFVNICRQTWAFIGPFWYPSMFEAVGIKGSAAVMVGVSAGASLLPIIALQIFGRKLR